MSAAQPYHLVGSEQLAALEQHWRDAVAQLAAGWWPEDGGAQLRARACDDTAQLPGQRLRHCVREGAAWLALYGDEHTWLALAESWLGCRAAAGGALVAELIRGFSTDLFRALYRDARAPLLTAEPPLPHWPQAALRPGAGTLKLELDAGGVTLPMLANPALYGADGAAPERRPAKPLAPCNGALGAARVRLAVTLAPARVPLTDIAALAAGDFLNLGHDLSGRVQVRGQDVQLTLPAVLGRSGDRKAIRITSVQSERKS